MIWYRTVFNVFVLILLVPYTVYACLVMVAPFTFAESQPLAYFTAVLLCFSVLEAWGFLMLPRTMVSSNVQNQLERGTEVKE